MVEAENGRVALERLRDVSPSVILLDLMMPEMDGFEFVAEFRRHEAWRAIPIVVITAKDLTADDRERLNGYVQKISRRAPTSREQLLAEVRELVVSQRRPPETEGLMAKILLVEDNEMNRDMLSRRLAGAATRWPSRWTASRAWPWRGPRRRRSILMDMSLPGTGRLGGDPPAQGAIRRRARSRSSRSPPTPCPATARRRVAAGCDDFDTKPVDLARLLGKIEALLGRGGRRVSIDPAAQLRHELRTPLNHIIGYTEMLLEELAAGDKPELAAGLAALRADARQLLGLLNEVLARGRDGATGPGRRARHAGPAPRARPRGGRCAAPASRPAAGAAALLADLERICSATERLDALLRHGGVPGARGRAARRARTSGDGAARRTRA